MPTKMFNKGRQEMNTPISKQADSDLLSDLIERSYNVFDANTPVSALRAPSFIYESSPMTKTPIPEGSVRKLSYQLSRLQAQYDDLVIRAEKDLQSSQRQIQQLNERCNALERDRRFLLEQEQAAQEQTSKTIDELSRSLASTKQERDKLTKDLDRLSNEWHEKESTLLQSVNQLKHAQQSTAALQETLQMHASQNAVLQQELSSARQRNQSLIYEMAELQKELASKSKQQTQPVPCQPDQQLRQTNELMRKLKNENLLLHEQLESLKYSKTQWEETLLENGRLKSQIASLKETSQSSTSHANLNELTRLHEAVKRFGRQGEGEEEKAERMFVLRLNPLPEEHNLKLGRCAFCAPQQDSLPKAPTATGTKEPIPLNVSQLDSQVAGLREQLATAEKRMLRLKEIFKDKIKEFREIVFILLGYQIDLQSDGSIRLLSLYAFHPDDWIMFRRDEANAIKLMDSPFLRQFHDESERFVKRGNSIPAFLSHITSTLWDKSTLAV